MSTLTLTPPVPKGTVETDHDLATTPQPTHYKDAFKPPRSSPLVPPDSPATHFASPRGFSSRDPASCFLNLPVPTLIEHALRYEEDSLLTSTGALATTSYAKTGRSPGDKRVVDEPENSQNVWWGHINIPLKEESFQQNRKLAMNFINSAPRMYVVDAFAGWDPVHRLKIRIVCTRPYHALFMRTMLIRPSPEELETFGEPDWVIYNAGERDADTSVDGVDTNASVSLNFATQEMVILGTQYAGEMKKGVFTIMNYKMPKEGHLSLHSSCNMSSNGDTTLFFGLSGTGKTTLSAEPHRRLIGDDEHVWTDTGVFNIEGGCYAKAINLRESSEPEIMHAIRYGAVLENIQMDPDTREVDYDNVRLTQNTRVAYPLEHIENAVIPAIGSHPTNIILLTCDAFGVLPPLSLLSREQLMYHFISGYTAKVAGTEMGILEPQTVFSPCFGAPFIVWHPAKYAELLADRTEKHGCKAWLVNTGWTGGKYGVGKRISLQYTRALIDAIHSNALDDVEYAEDPIFGVSVPTSCPGVPSSVLFPAKNWEDQSLYSSTAASLANLFEKNFRKYQSKVSDEVVKAGPQGVSVPSSPKNTFESE
eukprot:TRINITY_DN3131_c0_g1_i1.p1 TRINITY_DN3131_c0_g1~~TRINITY_DN3131_c0_g1_i1.p1  ORF type:complete len:592 (+),score=103.06 TRINITY_DN3131_c0_g1_i1:21-1796(+)